MTDVAYPSLTVAEKIFKALVWDNALDAAVAALAPYLGIFTPFVRYFILKVGDFIYSVLSKLLDMAAIPIVNKIHQTKFENEMVRLKLIAMNEGEESPSFKEEKENAKKSFKKFISYGAA